MQEPLESAFHFILFLRRTEPSPSLGPAPPDAKRLPMQDRLALGPGSRRPYEKPRLDRVALRPEEAVLGACKTNGNATCLLNSTAGS
jgi:hypothetical protein